MSRGNTASGLVPRSGRCQRGRLVNGAGLASYKKNTNLSLGTSKTNNLSLSRVSVSTEDRERDRGAGVLLGVVKFGDGDIRSFVIDCGDDGFMEWLDLVRETVLHFELDVLHFKFDI